MLTRLLTFTAFLAAIGQGFVTVTPTRRIKGHPEVELTLNCGDGNKAGVVEYWHTPFGDFHTPSFHSKLDPVFMHHDGSLVIPNSSRLHSGLYYCLQRQTEGTTLWPYELHVGPDDQKNQEHGGYEEGGGSSCDALRFRRDIRSEEEEQAVVSDEVFAAAVAASVLLAFVLGFSAGALSRTHVLRCLRTVTKRLQSPRQQQCQTDMPEHGDGVAMTTLPSTYDIQASQMEQVWDHNSEHYEDVETTVSSVTSSPPAKPQRSFRHKQPEEQETVPPYLEGCDYMKEEKRLEEEEEEEEVARGRSVEEKNKGCEEDGCYRLGEDRGSETETEEDKCSDNGEEKDGRKESREEKEERRKEEEVEEAGEQVVSRSTDRRSSEEEEEAARGNKEKWRDEKMEEEEEEEGDDGEKRSSEEEEETDISRDSEQSSRETEDDETGRKNQEDTMENGVKGGGGEPRPGRRSRVIRLYQYNEDGQRYCHLPDPAPGDTGPAPRLKQRTVSLTRLSAIMAAASAGPLDASQNKRDTEKEEEREERPRFHMEI